MTNAPDPPAERRAIMMQSEKVSEDLRAAFDVIAGTDSAVPALSGAIRSETKPSLNSPSGASTRARWTDLPATPRDK